ncbi:hypothetical protein [Deinococcus cellulosilyticus]|uniref:Uncharacterized protein n=1 Tax=Deinococcus cellulosilyticus (strain DSM 18568 / NBRC 106333 / KACC 11606 / 5516J-15) TaxID=1223518 RepID=A0A511N153_DEIC1|nr:hypothetical protein [Deinococcus cellulosilyticus]GEM46604.1 hypothetical protein DC3_22390 [Deinococcus cellulosilyticus NBRC 106333 = KACC 11606]
MIQLLDFLKTRAFAGVPLGASPEDLKAALGEPTYEYTDTFAHTLEYGLFEFAFTPKGKQLYMIHTQDFEVPTLGSTQELDPWVLKQGVHILDTMRAAEAENLTYTYDPENLTLKFASGVDLVFYGDTPATSTIYSIEARDMGLYQGEMDG